MAGRMVLRSMCKKVDPNHELREKLAECDLHRDMNLPLEICLVPSKNRGLFATQTIPRGSFVVEYAGQLVLAEEAKRREIRYATFSDYNKDWYLYYFKYGEENYCIDATRESGRLGRLINHSRVNSNLIPKVIKIDKILRICFYAKKNIHEGEELLYDYGERSRCAILENPWLED